VLAFGSVVWGLYVLCCCHDSVWAWKCFAIVYCLFCAVKITSCFKGVPAPTLWLLPDCAASEHCLNECLCCAVKRLAASGGFLPPYSGLCQIVQLLSIASDCVRLFVCCEDIHL
jgi:hypothetical protein